MWNGCRVMIDLCRMNGRRENRNGCVRQTALELMKLMSTIVVCVGLVHVLAVGGLGSRRGGANGEGTDG